MEGAAVGANLEHLAVVEAVVVNPVHLVEEAAEAVDRKSVV